MSTTFIDYCNHTSIYPSGISVSLISVIFIVPIYILVIYLAVQNWRQQRSFRAASHADVFTYHVAAFRMIWVLAICFYVCFLYPSMDHMGLAAYCLLSVTWYGENFIHVLTCVEQYLAVVHPIVYRGLRNERGVKIRNISLTCVWLLASVLGGVVAVHFQPERPILFLVPFTICLVIVSFCCLSVLYVLVRPGPGEGNRVDHSKKRAFNTISAILSLLWVWLGGILVSYIINSLDSVSEAAKCLLMVSVFIFNMPSGLIIPVLYLHRAGKLSFCFQNQS